MITFKHLSRTVFVLTLIMCGVSNVEISAQTYTADYYNVKSGNGKGLKFWSNDSYKIHMGNNSKYHYGPVTSYSIKMNMSNHAGRGWTWGVLNQTPIAALNTAGTFQTKGAITSIARKFYFGNVQNLYGDSGALLYWQSNNNDYTGITLTDKQNTVYGRLYGGGNGTQFGLLDGDANWSYKAVKDNYTAFLINNSEKMRISSSGKVGIGTINPSHQLHVSGITRSNEFVYGTYGLQSLTGDNYTSTYINSNHISQSRLTLRNKQETNLGSLIASSYGETLGLMDSNDHWSYLASKGNYTAFYVGGHEKMRINNNGNIGIGTHNSNYKLSVNGDIRAKEIIVENGWSDYVFYDDYELPNLEQEEEFIKNNGHLIGFESENDMAGKISLGDVSKRQQAKIEEIILHMIDMNKELNALKEENSHLRTLIAKISK